MRLLTILIIAAIIYIVWKRFYKREAYCINHPVGIRTRRYRSHIIIPPPPVVQEPRAKHSVDSVDAFNIETRPKKVYWEPIDIQIQYDYEPTELPINTEVLEPIVVPENDRFTLEAQNVHDSKLQRVLRKTFNDMEKIDDNDTRDTTNTTTIEDIMSNCPLKYKENVRITLDTAFERNNTMTGYNNATEKEIILQTYNMVKNDEDYLTYFFQNLNDCIEYGNVVCSTGVVSRVLSTQFIKDPEAYPKNEKAIFQEILSKASVIFEKTEGEKDLFSIELKKMIQDEYKDIMTREEMETRHKEIVDSMVY